MDEWNRLPCRSGCERNVTRCPGNVYGETCPPSEIERDLMHGQYWKKIVSPEAPSGSHVKPLQSRNIPLLGTAPDSDTQEDDQHNVTPPDNTEHPEISR